jgi:cytochrome c biogenesis protein
MTNTVLVASDSRLKRFNRASVELLSSMRFAISLLTIISIASIIGTVIKQGEPYLNYVNQFGPFWAEIFNGLGLFAVYTAWWFLLILAFLVVSVSFCVLRNAPKMLADIRAWKENVQEGGLRALHHHFEFSTGNLSTQAAATKIADQLAKDGYSVKTLVSDDSSRVLAKKGAASKWGYIFAHSAIVLICLGGLLDGDLFTRGQIWFGGKSILPESKQGMLISDIPKEHKLSEANPSYRANIFVPEGGTSATALLSSTSGSIIQELPFSISLKKFHVEYYSTGMPKLFMSEVLIKDLDTGKETEAKIKVNEPMIHRGVAIYQSSFEDGGSKLKLRAYPMQGAANSVRSSFIVSGDVGQSTKLKSSDGTSYTLEFSGFRPTNVENISNASGQADARGVATQDSDAGLKKLFSDRLGSAAKTSKPVDLKNVGPSVQYKLRDAAGQAREYSNYMQPLYIDEMPMFMLGVRQSSAEEFKYLRIPADANLSLNEWLTLRSLLQDPSARQRAVQRFIASISQQQGFAGAPQMLTQLRESASRSIELFSGSTAFAVDQAKEAGIKPGGFAALGSFIDKAVPEADQQKAAEVVLKVLNGVIWELWQEARAQLKLPPAKNDMDSQRFIQAATSALSDVNFYPAPLVFKLDSFEEVKASVFQVTRSPGKNMVYLGCLLLTLGIFAMFYLPERRIWVRSLSNGQQLFAMSSSRKTLDFEKEFEKYQKDFQ